MKKATYHIKSLHSPEEVYGSTPVPIPYFADHERSDILPSSDRL